jgi:hypothetical protein
VIPTTAQLEGPLAEAAANDSVDQLVAVETSGATPVLVGAEATGAASGEVAGGVVHFGTPLDEAWRLRVGGEDVAGRLGFGVTTAYDVAAPGAASLDYESPSSRTWWLVLQAVLWVLALVAASRLSVPGRFRIARGRDETLIDLDAEPGADLPPASDRTGFGGTYGTGEELVEPPVPESTGQGPRGPAP